MVVGSCLLLKHFAWTSMPESSHMSRIIIVHSVLVQFKSSHAAVAHVHSIKSNHSEIHLVGCSRTDNMRLNPDPWSVLERGRNMLCDDSTCCISSSSAAISKLQSDLWPVHLFTRSLCHNRMVDDTMPKRLGLVFPTRYFY